MKKKDFIVLAVFLFTFFAGILYPLKASTQVESHSPGFEVEHSIEGKDLDLYFNVRNFPLSKDRGWVELSLDGKSPEKIFANQKRLFGLTSGKHRIKAYLKGKDGRIIGSSIEFEVNIP